MAYCSVLLLFLLLLLNSFPSGLSVVRPFCLGAQTSLTHRGQLASVILTGTVVKLNRTLATVRVKRVIKGLSDVQNSRITVEGFGDPQICDSRVAQRDTKIFFLHPVTGDTFKLNSSVARINLRNLALLDASVAGSPFYDLQQIAPTPCEVKRCGFGAVCKVNSTSNEAFCACPQLCPTANSPVCGSDNVTYANGCQLRLAACEQHRRIRVSFQGACDVKDPCQDRICSFGSRCVPTADGKSARCICPQKCDNYGDSRGSKPVCGDNHKDYENLCQLQMESCQIYKDIRIKYTGRCDPCEGVSCPDGTVCKLNSQREPECRCSSNCPVHGDEFVCASDGKTYLTACAMRAESCKLRKDLTVVYHGKCEDGLNPCKEVKCSHGAECHIDTFNRTKCECPVDCEPILRPVCGRDGRTYDNKCELERLACRNQVSNAVDHTGACGSGACQTHQCPYGAICVEKSGRPECECPSCGHELEPVCGTNGISYDNKCKLQAESCATNKTIYVKYRGICEGCQGKTCDFYEICVADGKGKGQCKCPDHCNKIEDPVCGSDGQNYANECELQLQSCHNKEFLTIAYKGACDACENLDCLWGSRCEKGRCVCPQKCPKPGKSQEVCGSDGRLYHSECHLLRKECEQNRKIELRPKQFCSNVLSPLPPDPGSTESGCTPDTCKYAGICQDGDGDGDLECVCDLSCSQSDFSPVCGTDGIVYRSPCFMDLASCEVQLPIYKEISLEKCDLAVAGDDCTTTAYGCCEDGLTAARGPRQQGCPGVPDSEDDRDIPEETGRKPRPDHEYHAGKCQCNRLGSVGPNCDTDGQCSCRPGVTGRRCDSCLPGFWGLQLIARGNTGCIPCGCSAFGAQRDDCDQTIGRCQCKHGVLGMKCNACPAKLTLKPHGCVDLSNYVPPKSCEDKFCQFGARCQLLSGKPECVCNEQCPTFTMPFANQTLNAEVCGSDGNTYASQCQLKQIACRLQQDIVVVSLGPCQGARSTLGFTSDQEAKHIAKSTRDLIESEEASVITKPSGSQEKEFTESPRKHKNPCKDLPCVNGGTCKPDLTDLTKFKCFCSQEFTGVHCEQRLLKSKMYTIPEFAGKSYLEFAKLQSFAVISIRIEFKPMETEGLLLYNGEDEQSKGDFISLAMVSGHVEFRFNLGDGTILLKSPQQLRIDQWYLVTAVRNGRRGTLLVDGQELVSSDNRGVAVLSSGTLTLRTPLYLGKVPHSPDHIVAEVGTPYGFMGCVMSLRINDKTYDLRLHMSGDIVKSHMIGECGINPCSSIPCLNGAKCERTSEMSFRCSCKSGFTGSYCETALDACASGACLFGGTCESGPSGFRCICPLGRSGKVCGETDLRLKRQADPATLINDDSITPDFHGLSYMELPPFPGDIDENFATEVWLLPRKSSGLILYSGLVNDVLGYSGGDFVSLALVDGKVQFRYNLGSGIVNITADRNVTLNKWHHIKISRFLRNGSVQIDHHKPTQGQSPPPWDKLNLLSYPVFIGGVMNHKILPSLAGVHDGFDGAIQKVSLNGVMVDNLLKYSTLSSGISEYTGAPCTPGLCKNGAQCVPTLDKFICHCLSGYSGKHCEDVLPATHPDQTVALRFDGETHLVYKNKITDMLEGQKENSFYVRFKTNSTEGLLLWEWASKGLSVRGDYVTVAIKDGRTTFSFNLGKETKIREISSPVVVSDNKWHIARVWRSKRQGYLSVDDEEPLTFLSNVGATELNTDGKLWLGGCSQLPTGLPSHFYQGFVGCVGEVKIDNKPLHLTRHTRARKFSYCLEE